MAPLLQSEFTRPLLVSLLAPALVGQIQTSDCGAIDHMITLLQPLPPRNTAGLVVSALELIREKQAAGALDTRLPTLDLPRSEEHTSELQSLMRTSYAVFCLKKKHTPTNNTHDESVATSRR